MKHYCLVLLGLTFVSTYAADQVATARIKYYKTYDDAYNDNVSGYATITVTPSMTLHDVQDTLAKKLGPGGHLRHGSVRLFNDRPPLNQQSFGSAQAGKALLEDPMYSFWAFDEPLTEQEIMSL